MARRHSQKPRCKTCGLHLELCLCESFPRVTTTARVSVVQHVREADKPTNTARLLARLVDTVELLTYGAGEPAQLEQQLTKAGPMYLVYPREDALTLEQVIARHVESEPPKFLLLDGTWHQCSRMSRRLPGLAHAECVVLPEGPRSCWRGRTQHDPRGLSTFEAGVRLLERIDPQFNSAALWTAFEQVNARLVGMREGQAFKFIAP